MVNTTIDHYRKNKNIFLKDIEDFNNLEYEETDTDVLSQLRTEDILKLVQQLSPACRTVFSLYVVEGYSHKEVADELGISVGTSKSNLSKAKYNLQEMFSSLKKVEMNTKDD